MRLRYIEFPRDDSQRYYETHYRFFARLALAMGVRLDYVPLPRVERGFEVRADGLRILIDFGDHSHTAPDIDNFNACFRYHYIAAKHDNELHTYPLTPISFYDWAEYWTLQSALRYTASGDIVLNNQRPGAAAKERRAFVQQLLRERYGNALDTAMTDRHGFWDKVREGLVSVCVPGARNDILDRGQLQYWAFGACTISPQLDIKLPWYRVPRPGVHYVECAGDYSDLIEMIEWCRGHRAECRRIGAMAKVLFQQCCTPQRVWEWIELCLEVRNVKTAFA